VNLPVTALPIGAIIIDDRLQPRCDGLSEEHVKALMEAPEDWPPITVAHIDGSPVLVDGFHRHEAAVRLGCETIAAQAFYQEHGTDLFATAFGLNAKHGRPLTLRDRKTYAALLLQKHSELTDREIGRRTGLHHETVGALRAQRLRVAVPEREPGELPDDVGLFDGIRFGKKATREQKAIAGYIARLTIAMDDPYEENSTLEVWPDDPGEITRACILAMGPERATNTLRSLDADARYILDVTKAARALLKEVAS
jgi:hypothetical protein